MVAPPAGLPRWQPITYDAYSSALAEQAQVFFDLAVKPPCMSVAKELRATSRGPDRASMDRWEHLHDTQLELHRSLALALGGMWERHFQRHLESSLVILVSSAEAERVEKADWKKMCHLFEKARGFPLTALPCYKRLELLHRVSTVVRHGNGPRARELRKAHPGLFSHEPVRDWFSYFAIGGEPDYSVHRLDISFDQLTDFKDAIVDFWETIRALYLDSGGSN